MPEKQRQEEMRKLYSAIGYSENEVITPFPKEVTVYFISFSFFVGGLPFNKLIFKGPIKSFNYKLRNKLKGY